MNFQDWYDNLGPSIPHGHVAQMKMAWNAAIEEAAKKVVASSVDDYGNLSVCAEQVRELKA